jgi:CRISPR-associated protein Cas1
VAWRGVHVSRPCRLSVDLGCCVVENEDGAIRLAFEDIAYLVLDTVQVSLSGAVLAGFAGANVLVLVTDERHLPTGALLPLQGHFRQTGTLRRQLAATPALRKRLWQALVAAKVRNQAGTLERLGRDGSPALYAMAARVEPGDPDQIEARAARHYFTCLFDDFRRRHDEGDLRNAMLNYAYAIVRAALARTLAAQGFHPALGVWHDSVENAFNLADDLIEPFRAIADLHVARTLATRAPGEALTVDDRRALARLLVGDVGLAGETMTLLTAAERMADGLLAALTRKDPGLLPVPSHPDG